MQLVELSRQYHADLRIDPARIGDEVAGCHMVPLVVSEFRRAMGDFPIVLAKSPETGRFSPFALMGLAAGENLFWDGAKLDSTYIPLNLRRLPFFVGIDEETGGAPRNAVCVDMASPMVSETGSESLLDGAGRDTAYFAQIQKMLHELLSFKPRTEQFIAMLAERDLIVPLQLSIAREGEAPLTVTGIYGIDEEKFDRLPDATLAQLRGEGHLPPLYAMILSTAKFQSLIDRRNRADAQDRAWCQ